MKDVNDNPRTKEGILQDFFIYSNQSNGLNSIIKNVDMQINERSEKVKVLKDKAKEELKFLELYGEESPFVNYEVISKANYYKAIDNEEIKKKKQAYYNSRLEDIAEKGYKNVNLRAIGKGLENGFIHIEDLKNKINDYVKKMAYRELDKIERYGIHNNLIITEYVSEALNEGLVTKPEVKKSIRPNITKSEKRKLNSKEGLEYFI